jgi:hypothetical protein
LRKGTGHPDLPAYEGEDMEHYLRRLAKHLGREIAGPPLKPMPADVRLPYRDPGEEG